MKTILSVDASLLKSKIIEQDIKKYYDALDMKFKFLAVQTPQSTLDIINEKEIDIIFLDISSQSYDGIQLLIDIKKQKVRQAKIVGVTVLDDHTYRFEALKHKVYRYIYKPYDNKEIETLLRKYFTTNYYAKEINRTESFINIADIEHPENFTDLPEQVTEDDFELVSSYQERHIKHNAKEFIELYEEWGYDLEDLTDLELSLDRLMMSIMVDDDFESALPEIINILETYNKFLYIFTEFEELSKVVYSMVILLRDIDFETLESQTMVSKLILAAIQDLIEWKERVFVAEDAPDVYYINDPILNTFVQLQDLLS